MTMVQLAARTWVDAHSVTEISVEDAEVGVFHFDGFSLIRHTVAPQYDGQPLEELVSHLANAVNHARR